jgi:cystathionine beta-lyase
MEFTLKYFREKIPRIEALASEGTYLLWLDCRKLGLDPAALNDFMLKKAKVWLDEGPLFGPGGEGFQRINIGCPRSILEEGLGRIEKAVRENLNPIQGEDL